MIIGKIVVSKTSLYLFVHVSLTMGENLIKLKMFYGADYTINSRLRDLVWSKTSRNKISGVPTRLKIRLHWE